MNEHTQQEQEPPPPQQVRIQLCGPFQIAWDNPPNNQHILSLTDLQKQHRDIPQALTLLKMLLCRPGRQASRDWLLEQFWPEHAHSAASSRLDNVLTSLRKVLHSLPDGETLLHTSRGTSTYHLAAYPHLWVDSDALAWQVEHAARLERFGDDALPAWERAFTLLKRGPFLLDEPYASWAHAQRNELEGHARQCIHALVHLYLTRFGEKGVAEALLLLRTYWQQHPTDEDALRPLMELLGQQERYQEAEQYYQQFLLALEEEGLSSSPDPRTLDLHAFLQSKPLQRASSPTSSHAPMVQLAQHTVAMPDTRQTVESSEYGSVLPLALSASMASPDTLDLATWFGIRVNDLKAYGAFWSGTPITCQQQQAFIHTELEGWTTMTEQDQHPTPEHLVTRRMALATLATLSTSLLANVQFGSLTTSTIEEFLRQTATSLTTCWHLLRGDGLSTVEYVLPTYLPMLVALMKQYPRYKAKVSCLASQGFLLSSLIALHRLHFAERVASCKQAVTFARESGDQTLLVASLMHLGDAFFTNGQNAEMVDTYTQAEYQSQGAQISQFLRSKVLAELAHAYAHQGNDQEALRSVGEARALFTEESSDTPVFLSTDYGLFQLILFEGLSTLALGNYEEVQENAHRAHRYYQDASTKLSQIEHLSQTIIVPERIRIEIVNQRAFAAVKVRNLDEFEKYLLEGARGAKALASEKRRQEAITTWKAARTQWPLEKRVMELADALM